MYSIHAMQVAYRRKVSATCMNALLLLFCRAKSIFFCLLTVLF